MNEVANVLSLASRLERKVVAPRFVNGHADMIIQVDDGIDDRYTQAIRNGLKTFDPLLREAAVELKTILPQSASPDERRAAMAQLLDGMRTLHSSTENLFGKVIVIADKMPCNLIEEEDRSNRGIALRGVSAVSSVLNFSCVVSTYCCHSPHTESLLGHRPTREEEEVILAFVLRHEIGHLLGLEHHSGEYEAGACVMHEAANFAKVPPAFPGKTSITPIDIFCDQCCDWIQRLERSVAQQRFTEYIERILSNVTG